MPFLPSFGEAIEDMDLHMMPLSSNREVSDPRAMPTPQLLSLNREVSDHVQMQRTLDSPPPRPSASSLGIVSTDFEICGWTSNSMLLVWSKDVRNVQWAPLKEVVTKVLQQYPQLETVHVQCPNRHNQYTEKPCHGGVWAATNSDPLQLVSSLKRMYNNRISPHWRRVMSCGANRPQQRKRSRLSSPRLLAHASPPSVPNDGHFLPSAASLSASPRLSGMSFLPSSPQLQIVSAAGSAPATLRVGVATDVSGRNTNAPTMGVPTEHSYSSGTVSRSHLITSRHVTPLAQLGSAESALSAPSVAKDYSQLLFDVTEESAGLPLFSSVFRWLTLFDAFQIFTCSKKYYSEQLGKFGCSSLHFEAVTLHQLVEMVEKPICRLISSLQLCRLFGNSIEPRLQPSTTAFSQLRFVHGVGSLPLFGAQLFAEMHQLEYLNWDELPPQADFTRLGSFAYALRSLNHRGKLQNLDFRSCAVNDLLLALVHPDVSHLPAVTLSEISLSLLDGIHNTFSECVVTPVAFHALCAISSLQYLQVVVSARDAAALFPMLQSLRQLIDLDICVADKSEVTQPLDQTLFEWCAPSWSLLRCLTLEGFSFLADCLLTLGTLPLLEAVVINRNPLLTLTPENLGALHQLVDLIIVDCSLVAISMDLVCCIAKFPALQSFTCDEEGTRFWEQTVDMSADQVNEINEAIVDLEINGRFMALEKSVGLGFQWIEQTGSTSYE
jgi:hypothetical protein